MLSLVVPMFNEESFIERLLTELDVAVRNLAIEYEILVVDDGSIDQSVERVVNLDIANLQLICLESNSGKGSAVRIGIQNARGDLILVQDADLEYNPHEIVRLLQAHKMRSGLEVAIYGSRVLGANQQLTGWRSVLGCWPGQGLLQRAFGELLSIFHYVVTGVRTTDLLTGYKLYPRIVFDDWSPVTRGFETDHEITMRLHKLGIEIREVPISYNPRSRREGKKIRPRDAVRAVLTVWRFRD